MSATIEPTAAQEALIRTMVQAAIDTYSERTGETLDWDTAKAMLLAGFPYVGELVVAVEIEALDEALPKVLRGSRADPDWEQGVRDGWGFAVDVLRKRAANRKVSR